MPQQELGCSSGSDGKTALMAELINDIMRMLWQAELMKRMPR